MVTMGLVPMGQMIMDMESMALGITAMVTSPRTIPAFRGTTPSTIKPTISPTTKARPMTPAMAIDRTMTMAIPITMAAITPTLS
jgi:hypothetical protein